MSFNNLTTLIYRKKTTESYDIFLITWNITIRLKFFKTRSSLLWHAPILSV